MAEFLVELYVSCSDPAAGGLAERVRRAAAEVSAGGTPVGFLRSILVPEDETCLFLFEADSVDAVRAAARRAGLSVEHVAETAPDSQQDDPERTPS
ncbi:MAG TPA: nickel-binding protein [Gaiellaceae bacterium]|nr:nickel-binding protein [Gaiellaceae bacterium]